MAVTLRYLGWSAFEITIEDGRRLVLDPLLNGVADEGVPPSPATLEEFDGADFVLVTHAAGDHIGQAFEILGRSRARLVCDVATRFLALEAGIAAERIYFMAPGVEFEFGGLRIKALPAEHLSFRKIGEGRYISAPPLSYLVTSPGSVRLFLGGDTSISANHGSSASSIIRTWPSSAWAVSTTTASRSRSCTPTKPRWWRSGSACGSRCRSTIGSMRGCASRKHSRGPRLESGPCS